MNYLKEIISIVDKNKTKHIEIIGNDKANESKLYGLYDGILSGELDSDIQACKKIYGNTHLEKGYRNLKSRLEKKVINTLFLIDVDSLGHNEVQKTYFACVKNFAAVKLLLGGGARKTSMKLAEKTLKKALKFEFHDISIPLLQDLRLFYGTLIGDQKMFIKYNNQLKRVIEESAFEERVMEMYIFLSSQFVKSKTINQSHIKMAKEFSIELEEYLDKTDSRKFHVYAHLILVLRYEIENNYEAVIKASKRALSYLERSQSVRDLEIFAFTFKRFTSFIQLKKYAEAEIDAQNCFNLTQEGAINWFLTSQFYILLLFHSGKFQEAFEFFNHVKIILKRKKTKAEIGVDFWNIIEAFINYFIRVGKIKLPEGKRRPRFDYVDFMKKGKSSAFAKDKRGMNVTILILQVLFLLHEKNDNRVIDRMEPLTTYTSKYLRNDGNLRSNCFIKMLAKISEANFNRIALERRTKDLYQRLKSTPLEIANQPVEMEIVPSEVLWELVLESLDNNSPNRKKRK